MHGQRWLLLALAILLASGGVCARTAAAGDVPACNGSPVLADRRYNEVVYATTHNAMSSREDHWLFPSQNYNIHQQLNDGVRALMLDVHKLLGKTYLAHGNVLWGRQALVDGLTEIRTFLDAHPAEVVTLIFESRVPAADMAQAFEKSGLVRYVFVHQKGQLFPTLGEMVQANQRLVVFTDRGGGEYPWLHSIWDFCVETPTKVKRPEDLTNDKGRGDIHNELFILNHFLTYPTASPRLALKVNENPFFLERVQRSMRETGRFPNFIVVDYYDIGCLFDVVDTINGVPWPQRRQPVAGRPVARLADRRLTPADVMSPDLVVPASQQ